MDRICCPSGSSGMNRDQKERTEDCLQVRCIYSLIKGSLRECKTPHISLPHRRRRKKNHALRYGSSYSPWQSQDKNISCYYLQYFPFFSLAAQTTCLSLAAIILFLTKFLLSGRLAAESQRTSFDHKLRIIDESHKRFGSLTYEPEYLQDFCFFLLSSEEKPKVSDLQLKYMHSSSAILLESVWPDMKNKKGKRKITKAMLQTFTGEFAALNQSTQLAIWYI